MIKDTNAELDKNEDGEVIYQATYEAVYRIHHRYMDTPGKKEVVYHSASDDFPISIESRLRDMEHALIDCNALKDGDVVKISIEKVRSAFSGTKWVEDEHGQLLKLKTE